jgi:hypothetical protein
VGEGRVVKKRYTVMYQRRVDYKSFEWHQRGPYRRHLVARIVCWWQRDVVQATDDDCNEFLAIREDPYIIETGVLPTAKAVRP